MSHPHKRIQCKCGNIVMQCRCPYDKPTEFVETCDVCVNKTATAPETPAQQKQRIALALAEQIRQAEVRHGGSNQAAGLAAFSWLVEARIEIENLKRKLQ